VVLSFQGKNQRNFKKTTILKRQKGPEKRQNGKNERAHFFHSVFLDYGTCGAFCLTSFSKNHTLIFLQSFLKSHRFCIFVIFS